MERLGLGKEYCPFCQEWDCGTDCMSEWEYQATEEQEEAIESIRVELDKEIDDCTR